jgi:hypothetical protein
VKAEISNITPIAWAAAGGGVITHKQKMRMIDDGVLGGEFSVAAETAERHNIPLFKEGETSSAYGHDYVAMPRWMFDELTKDASRYRHQYKNPNLDKFIDYLMLKPDRPQ